MLDVFFSAILIAVCLVTLGVISYILCEALDFDHDEDLDN